MKKIKLTQNKFAVVDDADFELVSKFKWCAHKEGHKFYAVTNIGKIQIRMHQVVLGRGVDHKNDDGLDNRRENLRICNQSQNNANRRKFNGTSKFKGVYYHRARNKWQAGIKFEGRYFYLGIFEKEKDAANAYNEKARELFGEFAKMNNV
jgi:hypothetical protein